MFAGEAAGLTAMRLAAEASSEEGAPSLRIPEVLHAADYADGKGSFIIMEFLRMGRGGDAGDFGRAMARACVDLGPFSRGRGGAAAAGRQWRRGRGASTGRLRVGAASVPSPRWSPQARMHLAAPDAATAPEAAAGSFGFPVDNTIGATPQPNAWSDDWIEFYGSKRMAHQVNLAGEASIDRLWQKLRPRLGDFFDEDETIAPCILHGDLWSGNIGTAAGAPSIFDPACYYGHHEAEWGMSWCASSAGRYNT